MLRYRYKYFMIILFCLVFFSMSIYAQKNTVTAGLHTHFSQYGKEFRPLELCFDAGYNFTDNFFGNLRFENAVALFRIDNVDYNYINGMYGVNLGYKIIKFNGGLVDARIGFGDALTKKKDWKYRYYDAGINVNIGRQKVKPTFGLGVRYYDSRNDIHKNYTRAYMSLGFTFN